MKKIKEIKDLAKEELLDLLKDASKNWLAHDGLWFQAVEKELGMETAIELDRRAWEKFTVISQKDHEKTGYKAGRRNPCLDPGTQIQALR